MDDIYVAESVFRIVRERRQSIVDLMMYGNVKSMEQYRDLMGNMECLNHVEQELKGLLDKQERSND
jgi:hypothetical protein|tara:strand:- start:3058 stop:3255 length:198 start_codon:yes stop_codon:yes gene_type:complete